MSSLDNIAHYNAQFNYTTDTNPSNDKLPDSQSIDQGIILDGDQIQLKPARKKSPKHKPSPILLSDNNIEITNAESHQVTIKKPRFDSMELDSIPKPQSVKKSYNSQQTHVEIKNNLQGRRNTFDPKQVMAVAVSGLLK